MKKLKLNLQNFEGLEVLTREQLKIVMGGSGNSYDGGACNCDSDSECSEGYRCGGICDSGGYLAKCVKTFN